MVWNHNLVWFRFWHEVLGKFLGSGRTNSAFSFAVQSFETFASETDVVGHNGFSNWWRENS
jgi:hypothetical protein